VCSQGELIFTASLYIYDIGICFVKITPQVCTPRLSGLAWSGLAYSGLFWSVLVWSVLVCSVLFWADQAVRSGLLWLTLLDLT
jgi:hypothetical protein